MGRAWQPRFESDGDWRQGLFVSLTRIVRIVSNVNEESFWAALYLIALPVAVDRMSHHVPRSSIRFPIFTICNITRRKGCMQLPERGYRSSNNI